MVASFSALGLVVDHSEIVHAKPLEHGEGDHQGSIAHVADVHGHCEVGDAIVGQFIPAYVVGFPFCYEEADFHVIGDGGWNFLAVGGATCVDAGPGIGVPVRDQVDFVQANAILNEFEVVPVHATGVGDALAHAESRVHGTDALGANASHGVSLVGADPRVVSTGEPIEQPVKVVPNDGGI